MGLFFLFNFYSYPNSYDYKERNERTGDIAAILKVFKRNTLWYLRGLFKLIDTVKYIEHGLLYKNICGCTFPFADNFHVTGAKIQKLSSNSANGME
jgi:hypothetical protein